MQGRTPFGYIACKSSRMAKKNAPKKAAKKPAGIGRSAITGKFMSVSSAKAHKKTAIVEGASKRRKK